MTPPTLDAAITRVADAETELRDAKVGKAEASVEWRRADERLTAAVAEARSAVVDMLRLHQAGAR